MKYMHYNKNKKQTSKNKQKMTHTKLKKIALLSFLMAAGTASFAQMKVGGTPGAANSNAYLELGDATGATKGLLIPRVQLTATNAALPLTAHVAGMMVYNTATAGSGTTQVTPGYYFNDGTKWISLTSNAGANSWNDVSTQAAATANTQNVYQMGAVGIGTNMPDTMNYKLDVAAKDARIHTVRVGLGAGNIASNTVVGQDAFTVNTSGWNNVAIGSQALKANTTGQGNVAVGVQAAFLNTSGKGNIAIGSLALDSNTTGSYNTAMGLLALQSNHSGLDNTAIGTGALKLSNGTLNTAVGFNSLQTLHSGDGNVTLGSALPNLVTGDHNVAIGLNSGTLLNNGSGNIFIGYNIGVPSFGNYSNLLNIGDLIFGTEMTSTNNVLQGLVGIAVRTPKERLDVDGAVKIGTRYAITANGQTTPVPAGGEGTIVYSNGHFFGWTGTSWKQLDN